MSAHAVLGPAFRLTLSARRVTSWAARNISSETSRGWTGLLDQYQASGGLQRPVAEVVARRFHTW
ncbi:hypothetical protein [Actinocorallia longicatena]|uniref:hypothetical protein n=1 Tax=Actinocorallia longicatena TaxID=111803 RepID=UPI0031DDA5C0